jgi:hypothetical protein
VNRPPRPTLNVDALGALLDRALGHPFVGVLEDLAPRSVAAARAARANLPETLGRLQQRAAAEVGSELDDLLARLLEPLAGGKGDRK